MAGPYIEYKWLTRDVNRESAGYKAPAKGGPTNESQMVTPYGFMPGEAWTNRDKKIVLAKNFKAGEKVRLDLGSVRGLPGHALRYTKKGKVSPDAEHQLVWERIPDELLVGKTMGELCNYLTTNRPEAYPAFLYGAEQLGRKDDGAAHLKMPLLMFDHWHNTDGRFEVIENLGGFQEDPVSYPLGTHKWVALTLKPAVKPVSVDSSDTNQEACEQGVLTDSMIDELCKELVDLRQLAVSTLQLLEDSYAQGAERLRVLAPLSALHVALRCCKQNGTQAEQWECDRLIKHVDDMLPLIKRKIIGEPMKQLLTPEAKAAAVDARSQEMLAKLLGYSNDLASSIAANQKKIRDRIFGSGSLRNSCKNVFVAALNQERLGDDKLIGVLWSTIETLTLSLEVLAQESGGEGGGERLWKLLEKQSKAPAKAGAQVKGESALEVMLSVVGYATAVAPSAANATLQIVGNLAGPPSLSIAMASAAAAWSIPSAAKLASKAGGSSFGKVATLRSRLHAFFAKAAGPTTAKNLVDAAKSKDLDKMAEARDAFAGDSTGHFQASLKWKACTNLLQIVSLLGALESYEENLAKHTGDELLTIVDHVTIANTVAQVTLGTVEVVLETLGKFDGAIKTVCTKLGTALGFVSCLLGILQGGIEFGEGLRDHDTSKMLSGGLTAIGSTVMLFALLTGNPYAAAAGMMLVAAGAIVSLIREMSKGDPILSQNKVCLELLDGFANQTFFLTVYPDIKASYTALRGDLPKALLPRASNDMFTVESLRRMGFGVEQVRRLVDGTPVYEEKVRRTKNTQVLVLPPGMD